MVRGEWGEGRRGEGAKTTLSEKRKET